eukprot:TRINITY_DN4628_c0_g1_i3.p1 TRINITY_DN4628_c0_g1~~TRINITY_DN4628_c0_g1_i3.p1  ORF type:complete len:170 (+),score=36.20 TRINITY_DN4628_c0_g1_i3:64-573(+)
MCIRDRFWLVLLYFDQNSVVQGDMTIYFASDSLKVKETGDTIFKQSIIGYTDQENYEYTMIDLSDNKIMCYALNTRLNLTYSPTAPRLKRNDEIKLVFENHNFKREIKIPIFNQDGSMVNWTRLIIVCSLFVFVFIFLVFLDRWIKKKRTFEDKLLVIDDMPKKKILID